MPHYCRWKDAVQSSYREVAAAANQRSPLPVVPPPEDDELISSWLDRVARFYGLPLRRLLSPYGIDVRTLRLDDIDAGSSAVPLRPVADMLGIEGAHLASRTMAAAYPMATQLLARHQRVLMVKQAASATLVVRIALSIRKSRGVLGGFAVIGCWRRGRFANITLSR
jgi:hypothetical protein